jgi:hypothetical protein
VPITDWPPPLLLTVVAGVYALTPEPLSVQLKVTVTAWAVHCPAV